jgi:hypothetical protein
MNKNKTTSFVLALLVLLSPGVVASTMAAFVHPQMRLIGTVTYFVGGKETI